MASPVAVVKSAAFV